MKEIDRNGHEHVDYIPSQIFTEFIRWRVIHDKRKIDGIVFPSVKKRGKCNYALFCDNSEIISAGETDKKKFLKYLGAKA